MGQELVIPDTFKKIGPAKAFSALNPQDDNLAEGIGQSYGVIGYKGKVWSLRYRGERHNFVRPDDGTPSSYIDVVILGQAKQKSKSLYKAYDKDTSEGDRPLCSSIDGTVPDAGVLMPNGDATPHAPLACAVCPKNVWKTDPQTGRKGRDCTDYKRLAVLVLPTQTKAILGAPLMEPVFLRVPPASLNSLAIMGETMANQGFHFSSYVTRIGFDPNESHPKMDFRPLQGLTDGEAPLILKLREDPTVTRITNGDVTGVHTIPLPHSTTAAIGTGVQDQQTFSPTSTKSAQPATKETPPVSSVSATGLESFGGVTNADPCREETSSPSILQAASIQTTADTGEPEEADADLDARIAALINTAS